jgi:malate/lactate dehydrogenase
MNGTGKFMRTWRRSMRYRKCGRITAIVILMSFLTAFPVSGDQPMAMLNGSENGGTRFYSDGEVAEIVEEISAAAEEAILGTAAEAAKAAALAGIEREAVLGRERAAAVREAEHWQGEYTTLKRRGIKNAVIAGVVCFVGGLVIGAGGTLILAGGK